MTPGTSGSDEQLVNVPVRGQVSNLFSSSGLPLVTNKRYDVGDTWRACELSQICVAPRTSHRNKQLMNMAVRCYVNDLLGVTCVPLVTSEGGIGVRQWRTG